MEKTEKKQVSNTLYNTVGTLFYFACQYLLTIVVVRIAGLEDAGVFSMVISITNIFACISLFGLRNYQVSDVRNRHTANQYLQARILTISLSFLLFLLILPVLHLDAQTLSCSMVYIFYKYGETITDLCFGYFQKADRYRSIFISYTMKGVLTLAFFILVLALSKSLWMTLFINTVVYYLVVAGYDFRIVKKAAGIRNKNEWRASFMMLRHCWPLMLYQSLVPYLNFVTRYAVSSRFGDDTLGGYSTITIVISVLSTLMNSVFVTIIPQMSRLYLQKRFASIRAKTAAASVFILLLIVLIYVIAGLIGTPVFVLVFGEQIREYMYLLPITVIASGLLTFNTFFSSLLIAFRKIRLVLIDCLLTVLVTSFSLQGLISSFGLAGSVYAMSGGLIAGAAFELFCIGVLLISRKNRQEDDGLKPKNKVQVIKVRVK